MKTAKLMTPEQQNEFTLSELARIRLALDVPALPWPKPTLVAHRNKIKDKDEDWVRGSEMPTTPRLESFIRNPEAPGYAVLRKRGAVTAAGAPPRDSSFLRAVDEGAFPDDSNESLLIFLSYQSHEPSVLRALAPLQVLDFFDRNPSLWMDTRTPDADGGFGRH